MAAAPEKPADTPQPLQQPNGPNVQPEARNRAAARVADPSGDVTSHQPGQVQVIRRNGKVTHFDPSKIKVAMTKAFLAVEGSGAAASNRIHHLVDDLSEQVVSALTRRLPGGGTVHIEDIQDQVELALMRAGEHKVARDYVIYRDARARERAEKAATSKTTAAAETGINVTLADGGTQPLDVERLRRLAREAASGLEGVDDEAIVRDTLRNLFDGVKESDVGQALVMSARAMIEREPAYSQAAARLLLDVMRREALGELGMAVGVETQADLAERYADYFSAYIKTAGDLELLDKQLSRFDLARLGAALKPERDLQFTYLGLQTLYDRYFIHTAEGPRIELPQAFFMRVAMGLAINEIDREERAIEFYELLSSFDFMSSTPTLFNSGTLRPQLSSCYLTTVPDDLDGIYGAIKDNALLSKFAGGLGNDWSRVRGMGAHIKGTNGKSQGVVPFLKVANDTAVAVNQCLAADTLVWTKNGIKVIKNVRVGDLVLGKEGYYREVQDHMIYNQRDPMVEIKARHTAKNLKITAGHPIWSVRVNRHWHSPKQIVNLLESGILQAGYNEADALKTGDYIAQTIPKEVVPITGFDEEDARLYGIMLGDGHVTKGEFEWGVSGNPQKDSSLEFVEHYLQKRGIHYWISRRNDHYQQIKWSLGKGLLRDATSGRFVGGTGSFLPFSKQDIYNELGEKYIAPRLMHLPRNQTKALIRGLLETDGSVSGGVLLNFSNTSIHLIEGLRYLLLRLGIPSAASFRERVTDHYATRQDKSRIHFSGSHASYDLRIPSVPEFAEYFDYKVAKKKFWFKWGGNIFTRITGIKEITPEPFVFDLKVEGDHSYNTTVCAISNGGKRKGAVCAYLETWHIDIEEFVELRKNTGDDRRRTHDMNTANWVPDLFMKRVAEDQHWTLFSPDETPDLHDLTGQAFEQAYLGYEAHAERGELKVTKRIKAVDLWRKMLAMLFETGHPWITFKDPCNLRYTNQHVGQVHSSNLCTEITLHTNDREIAVCNLGSVNLAAHVTERGLDTAKLRKTVRTAMRMLDNVIDYNFYNVPQARNANLRHRPVGLGLMGFQDALYELRIPYASQDAVRFADHSMEALSYYAIEASSELAAERGRYQSFDGSLWSEGILPIDSVQRLAEDRSGYLEMDTSTTLDWNGLRERVQTVGMRNSNCLAIAPTATISNIVGVSQSIEPTYQNLFVKSNLSGEFTVVNPYLVRDLKALGLWDSVMVSDLKYYDGSLQQIDRIPDDLKELYATAFEVDPRWLVEAGSRRQKWLDQAQSLNLYMSEPSGKKLDNLYKLAWVRGLKTTYYLRSMGATHVEKSTMADSSRANRLSAVGGTYQSPGKTKSNGGGKPVDTALQACAIDDPECESCQ